MADTTLTKAQPAAYTPRTNLDAAIASQPDEAWVAAAGPREHGFLIKIDDEYEYVYRRGDQFARPWQVERGALGSTPAAHSNAATVAVEPAIGISGTDGIVSIPSLTGLQFPSGTLSDLGSGVGGVGLVFRLLGPYAVAFNTPDLMNPVNFGADVGLIPSGSLFQVFAIVKTNWNQAGELAVVVSEDGVAGANRTAAAYTSIAAAGVGTSGFMERFRESAQTPVWGISSADLHIVVGFFPDAANPTTGTADIYAIVASPAA